MTNDGTDSEKTGAWWTQSLVSSVLTAVGIALAVASFIWIDGDSAKFIASAAGLTLVLWGRYLSRSANKGVATPTESPED